MSSSRLLDTLVLALVPAIIFTTGDQVISQSFPNGTFVDLEPVASVNTPDFYEGFPGLTADGLELYFTRGELAITGSSDIWVTRRTTKDEEFGPPIPLGPAINTEAGEFLRGAFRQMVWQSISILIVGEGRVIKISTEQRERAGRMHSAIQ